VFFLYSFLSHLNVNDVKLMNDTDFSQPKTNMREKSENSGNTGGYSVPTQAENECCKGRQKF